MADITLVADLAESLLATCEATLDSPPARSLVTWQDAAVPAGNCDELAVCVPRLWRTNDTRGRGQMVPPQPKAQASLPVCTLRVRLSLYCWPIEGGDPPPAKITAKAVDAFTQNGALWLGICEQVNAGTLFSDVTDLGEGCLAAEVMPWTPTGSPQGGMVSGHFDVNVTITYLPQAS